VHLDQRVRKGTVKVKVIHERKGLTRAITFKATKVVAIAPYEPTRDYHPI
jgi:DNA repair protein RadC